MRAKYVRDMQRSKKQSRMREHQQCGTNRVRTEPRIEHKHMEGLLDEGLEQTFPASDPVAVYFDAGPGYGRSR